MDLTKITTPFGLLDEVYGEGAQEALKAHGGPYEYFTHEGNWLEAPAFWMVNLVYRVKPAPLTKPSIDWSHVAPKFKWMAQDENGDAYLYAESKPDAAHSVWVTEGAFCECSAFPGYTPGTCDWKDSLVERPA